MALRLVLVGAVAGLGLSLPTEGEFDTWVYRAQGWMNARLADWDASSAAAQGRSVFVPGVGAETPPASKPDEGREQIPTPVRALAAEIDAAFDAVQDEMVAGFAADLVPAESVAETRLAAAEPTSLSELERTGAAFDAVQDEMVAGFAADLVPAPPAEAPALVEAPRLEPLEVDDDLYPGPAFALNREAEGLVNSATAPGAEAPSTTEKWTQAVRLTREAVYAWSNLLHGPAVVTIDR